LVPVGAGRSHDYPHWHGIFQFTIGRQEFGGHRFAKATKSSSRRPQQQITALPGSMVFGAG
jgi:hypothetical protein